MGNSIKRILSNKDGKVLAKNFSYLSLLQVSNHIFPMITLPYLARVLGVEPFGQLAIGMSVIAYFQTIIDYGFNFSSVKNIARNKDNREYVNSVVMETVCARLILLITSYILIFLLITFVPFVNSNKLIVLSTSTILLGHVLLLDWFFQAIEKMEYIAIISLLSNSIFTVLVFFMIKSPSDYYLQPILTATGTLISSVVCWAIIIIKFGVRIKMPSLSSVRNRIREGFNLFVSIFFPTIYTNLNTLLLGVYNGRVATGIYSGGARFSSMAYSVTMLFSRVFFPFLSRRIDKHKMYARLSLIIGLSISLFFFFGADLLVSLFLGKEFEKSADVLRIVSFTPLAMCVFNAYGTNYLAIQGGERYLRNIVIFTTFFGITFGIIGAVYFSYIGVAVCSILTQGIRACASYVVAKKIMKNR